MSRIGFYCYVPDADVRADLIRFLSDVDGLQISDMYWGNCIRYFRCWVTRRGEFKCASYPMRHTRVFDYDCRADVARFKSLVSYLSSVDLSSPTAVASWQSFISNHYGY